MPQIGRKIKKFIMGDKYKSKKCKYISNSEIIENNHTDTVFFSEPFFVTVIIPNYNHSVFLTERIESVINQDYKNIEILIFDDLSTDNSLDIIKKYEQQYEFIRYIPQNIKSSSIFSQWHRGIQEAKGDIIWICESDDSCDRNFLSTLLPEFQNTDVMIAFGKILSIDSKGKIDDFLIHYRNRLENLNWDSAISRSSYEWFSNAFGAGNAIPNVGGCLIRNQKLSQQKWEIAESFKIVGDWYLYLILSQGGTIVYNPKAIAYFRIHTSNTSVKSYSTDIYYKEHQRLLEYINQEWPCTYKTTFKALSYIAEQYDLFYNGQHSFPELIDCLKILNTEAISPHVLICSLGFHLGGGEIAPILLANHLLDFGWKVSFFCLENSNENKNIKEKLDSRIPIFYKKDIFKSGLNEFLCKYKVTLINSHFLYIDTFFIIESNFSHKIPYVVTLHGSYEAIPIPTPDMDNIVSNVDFWLYLSKKNIQHLTKYENINFSKKMIKNGVEPPIISKKITRDSLGIDSNSTVFMIASRCIPQKGWHEAIKAMGVATNRSGNKFHLLLCGDGPYLNDLLSLYKDCKNISFLGYQKNVYEYYALCDCALLPTRFTGESLPLTLIQAIQLGLPSIATDIGEINNLLSFNSRMSGIVVKYTDNDDAFISSIADAMNNMSDKLKREAYSLIAKKIAPQFNMDEVAQVYKTIFQNLQESSK